MNHLFVCTLLASYVAIVLGSNGKHGQLLTNETAVGVSDIGITEPPISDTKVSHASQLRTLLDVLDRIKARLSFLEDNAKKSSTDTVEQVFIKCNIYLIKISLMLTFFKLIHSCTYKNIINISYSFVYYYEHNSQ